MKVAFNILPRNKHKTVLLLQQHQIRVIGFGWSGNPPKGWRIKGSLATIKPDQFLAHFHLCFQTPSLSALKIPNRGAMLPSTTYNKGTEVCKNVFLCSR